MQTHVKLITEFTDNLHYLSEAKGDGTKSVFIEGIFMQAEKVNRNKRKYPKAVLEAAVNRYVKEQVSTNRAVGELNHPEGPAINLDKVSHKITSLVFEGDNAMGRAEILNTPMGAIVKGLIAGGVQLGVSSRGMGSVKTEGDISIVGENFILSTVDIVQDPSADEAFVNGIMEGVEWAITPDGSYERFVEGVKKTVNTASRRELDEVRIAAFANFMELLKT